MNTNIILQLVIVAALLFLIYSASNNEGLCVKKPYGYVTDVPASRYVDANMALVKSTSLGQAPLGDPRWWIGNRSPITQGQYGLYASVPMQEALETIPVYTDQPLPAQCTPLN